MKGIKNLPQGLADEKDSRLKTACLLLFDWAQTHRLCMDLCGVGCTQRVIELVKQVYETPKETGGSNAS